MMPPILQTCCCWSSLRQASYACALYTTVYFTMSSLIMTHFIYEERLYLVRNNTFPDFSSFLEPGVVTYTTLVFSFTVLTIGVLGFMSSIILVIALITDSKHLLLPWIVLMIIDSIVELLHCAHLFFIETIEFNPVTAIIFTLDFFLVCLHTYALLCVISLYQEYTSEARHAEQERMINTSSHGTSGESRINNTSTVSTTRIEVTPADYSTFNPEVPRSSSMRKTGQKANKGVSFADDTIIEAPF